MFKVSLYKKVNARSGDVPLRFRLKDGRAVDLGYETGKMVPAKDMMAFSQDGTLQPGVTEYDAALLQEIERCKLAMSEVYMSLCQNCIPASQKNR